MAHGETLALVDELLHVGRVELAQAPIAVLLVAERLVRQQALAVLHALARLVALQLIRLPVFIIHSFTNKVSYLFVLLLVLVLVFINIIFASFFPTILFSSK